MTVLGDRWKTAEDSPRKLREHQSEYYTHRHYKATVIEKGLTLEPLAMIALPAPSLISCRMKIKRTPPLSYMHE
jgi:hypothetical protein